MKAARWALVRCAGGEPILAWVDGRTWRGWLVPWFPDASMERIAETYYDEDKERAPWQATCGTWDMRDDDEEPVTLERHRRVVTVPAGRGYIALNDAAEMGWCWEMLRGTDENSPPYFLAMNDVAKEIELIAPKKGRKS